MTEFPAKYRGECPAGDTILPGQEVMYVDEELWHVECVSHSGGPERGNKFQGTTLDEMGY